MRKNRPPLDTSVSYFCRCNDHSKIIKEVESILFSLSLILAIASKVFSLAGLTRFIILAPDPYFQKQNYYQIHSSMSVDANKSICSDRIYLIDLDYYSITKHINEK